MLRSFAVILEIVFLVMVLQLPFVQYLLSDIQTSLSDWMTHIAQREERAQLADIKLGIAQQYSAMRPYQQDYLDEVLSSRARTVHFYEAYCKSDDSNPYIYGATLSYFCSEITRSSLLNSQN